VNFVVQDTNEKLFFNRFRIFNLFKDAASFCILYFEPLRMIFAPLCMQSCVWRLW